MLSIDRFAVDDIRHPEVIAEEEAILKRLKLAYKAAKKREKRDKYGIYYVYYHLNIEYRSLTLFRL